MLVVLSIHIKENNRKTSENGACIDLLDRFRAYVPAADNDHATINIVHYASMDDINTIDATNIVHQRFYDFDRDYGYDFDYI